MTDLSAVRADFPLLSRTFSGMPIAYLDSAATTQKPESVIEAMNDHYRLHNANVHRGAYRLSDEATTAYEQARQTIAAFIGAATPDELVFTRGTTAGINLVAQAWARPRLSPGDRIVLTVAEHHSNLVPWQLLARQTGAELAYLDIGDDYQIRTEDVASAIDERTKVVAFSGMSNVTGAIPPRQLLVDAAHAVGAVVVLDGAQAVPHLPVDVTVLDVDFMAFSGHKMLGPTGIGGLWGRRNLLEEMEPVEGGGEMISDVGLYESRWAPVPHKFEAGTPPITEAVGLAAAVRYLDKLGMPTVRAHEREITAYAVERLSEVPDLRIHGPRDLDARGGAVSFTLGDIHAHDIATVLDEEFAVAIRAGHHCAKPLMRRLDVASTARASFYVYTVTEEIDRLAEGLHRARQVFGLS